MKHIKPYEEFVNERIKIFDPIVNKLKDKVDLIKGKGKYTKIGRYFEYIISDTIKNIKNLNYFYVGHGEEGEDLMRQVPKLRKSLGKYNSLKVNLSGSDESKLKKYLYDSIRDSILDGTIEDMGREDVDFYTAHWLMDNGFTTPFKLHETKSVNEEFVNERIKIFDPIISKVKDKTDMIRGKGKYSPAAKRAETKAKAKADKEAKKKLTTDLKYLIRTKKKENIVLALQVARNEGIQFGIKFAKTLEGIDLSGLDLTGLDFSDINLKGVDFSGSNLKGAKFVNSYLSDANFSNAVLEDCIFTANNINFNNINFSGASFFKANIKVLGINCNFNNAYLTQADLSRSAFRDCTFEKAELQDTNVFSVKFTDCSFKDASLLGIDNMAKVRSIAGCDFVGADYLADDFAGLAKSKIKTAKNLNLNK